MAHYKDFSGSEERRKREEGEGRIMSPFAVPMGTCPPAPPPTPVFSLGLPMLL